MCGIAGMVSLAERSRVYPDLVRSMMGRLVHRGPDESGCYVNDSRTSCLGHQRLRVIDLASGRQPLANEDGSVVLTFNGEIYNFRALRDELAQRGHRFRSQTDTEVIVHLYEEEGTACLERLKGMFAFALWDERAKKLFLARDRLGKKPVYYTVREDTLLFASELHALQSVLPLGLNIDEVALDHYMTFGYIPAPRTIYRHVKKLEAGQFLTVESGDLRLASYWQPPGPGRSEDEECASWGEAKEEVVHRLRAATARRMVSDVPVGCFLSGGVDSSTVLSFMAELSTSPVKTFSAGFPERDYSELDHARRIARYFGTDHHEFILEPCGVGMLDRLVRSFGEPLADSSAVPTWYLSELAGKSATVILTGDGGDELFGGYRWYRTGQVLGYLSFLPPWAARSGSSLASLRMPRLLKSAGKAAALLAMSPDRRYAAQRQMVSPETRQTLYSREFGVRAGGQALTWLANRYEQTELDDSLNRMMATDLRTYMAEDLLVKVDRMSMAHSIECRSPFLDVDLVQWALRLPASFKLNGSGSKLLLRAAIEDRFPAGSLDRPKQGFQVPLERWFRRGLQGIIADRVLHGPLARLEVFDPVGLRRIVHEHQSGDANHEACLWALVVLATWLDKHVT